MGIASCGKDKRKEESDEINFWGDDDKGKNGDENWKQENTEEKKKHSKNQQNFLSSIPINVLTIITDQKKNICKIEFSDVKMDGTGFFCKIPFPDNFNKLPVLITNNHVLGEKDITTNRKIKFILDNNEEILNYELIIDNSRKTYTNKEYDITIIEIKCEDNIDINSFLEIDNMIFTNNSNDSYKDKSIYILHYKKGEECEFSHGFIRRINNDNYTIEHKCQTDYGSSGSPILSIETNRVLGIHRGYPNIKNPKWNLGTLISHSIKEFNEIKGKAFDKNKFVENDEIDEINIIYSNYERPIYENDILKYPCLLKETIQNDKIFGEKFVENNKNICKIYINEKEYELCSYLNKEFNKVFKVNKIKLKGVSKITDMSYMFCGCLSLMQLPDIHLLNTSKVTSLKCLFGGCKFFKDFPDMSKWNTKNVEDISYMFYECHALEKLCGISKWDTSNIKKMNNTFDGCFSLKFLPNISKWDTSNVEDMSYMFCSCKSLKKISDISGWKTDNVANMKKMFFRCSSLSFLPDISKWNISKENKIKFMFDECPLLSSLPDFYKIYLENTNNLNDSEEELNENRNKTLNLLLNLIKTSSKYRNENNN